MCTADDSIGSVGHGTSERRLPLHELMLEADPMESAEYGRVLESVSGPLNAVIVPDVSVNKWRTQRVLILVSGVGRSCHGCTQISQWLQQESGRTEKASGWWERQRIAG